MRGYQEDLAYIHDAGFSGYCLKSTPGLLQLLRRSGITAGLVVDLGCGSGRWARALNRRGYAVLGVDQSADFIRMARATAPESKFVTGSLWTTPLPPCAAVTSIGECLNYGFDAKVGTTGLDRLFSRVYRALLPRGGFLFDAAGPERAPENGPRRSWFQGRDWAILVETTGDRRRKTLMRRITCFRRRGEQYRRSDEIHQLRLYRPEEIAGRLTKAGFEVATLSRYGRFSLPAGITAFLARK